VRRSRSRRPILILRGGRCWSGEGRAANAGRSVWTRGGGARLTRGLSIAARRLAPHQLRHAHAVEMSREGVPLVVIQRQLGHADLGVTSVYLRGIDNTEIVHAVHERPAPDDPCGQRASGHALTQTSRGPCRLARPTGLPLRRWSLSSYPRRSSRSTTRRRQRLLSVEASVRRRWRESSKRSSASVGAGAPFRGEAQAGLDILRRAERSSAVGRC
jgi:Phage integrase family